MGASRAAGRPCHHPDELVVLRAPPPRRHWHHGPGHSRALGARTPERALVGHRSPDAGRSASSSTGPTPRRTSRLRGRRGCRLPRPPPCRHRRATRGGVRPPGLGFAPPSGAGPQWLCACRRTGNPLASLRRPRFCCEPRPPHRLLPPGRPSRHGVRGSGPYRGRSACCARRPPAGAPCRNHLRHRGFGVRRRGPLPARGLQPPCYPTPGLLALPR